LGQFAFSARATPVHIEVNQGNAVSADEEEAAAMATMEAAPALEAALSPLCWLLLAANESLVSNSPWHRRLSTV
jgi:hypothetical protein